MKRHTRKYGTKGVKWDLFLESLLAAVAEAVVGLVVWVGKKAYKAMKKHRDARRQAGEND